MLFPVRCFSCNSVVGRKWNEYSFLTKQEKIPVKEVFEKLKIKRYCCRRMFLSHPDNMIDDLLSHNKDLDYVKIY